MQRGDAVFDDMSSGELRNRSGEAMSIVDPL